MVKMLRFMLLLVAVTWARCPEARAQAVHLDVQGAGVKVVQVERAVIVKVDVTLVTSLPFTVKAPAGAGLYFWTYPASVTAVDEGDVLRITAAPKGELTVSVKSVQADWDAKKFVTKFGSVTFAVGDVPQPTPPVPPEPPGPAPVSGLRVLILEESMDRTKLPASQILIMTSKPMRDWLDSKCMADPGTGSGKAWYIADKDLDFSTLSVQWQTMMAKGKGQAMPAVVIAGADGNPVFVGPLPATVAEAQSLIGKYVPTSQRKAG